ncbi:MAG: hypothetical protein LBG18_07130 [Mediterranea sp.]|nr:hypothetical protein [Mediterranea sp.]
MRYFVSFFVKLIKELSILPHAGIRLNYFNNYRPDGDMEQINRLIFAPTVTWSKTID